MNAIDAILLGVLQGLTEFLPVSSSAHLVAGQALLGSSPPGVALEVALHVGTLVAVGAVLRREIVGVVLDGFRGTWSLVRGAGLAAVLESAPLFPVGVAVLIGALPATLVGLVLADAVSGTFESLVISGALLCATGVLLLSARFVPAPEATAVGPVRGLIIGVAQAAALLPGLSRSGITIVAARWLRVEGPAAARFSFLLAIPAVLGAAVLKLAAESPVEGIRGAPLLAGAAASAVSGTVALLLLLRIVRSGRIHWFAAYCIPAGLLMAIVGLQS